MINYGTDQIFEARKTLQSFQKWAAAALPQNLVPPTPQQIQNGVESLNTYPASWHNVYNQEYTVNLTMASMLVQDLYAELLAVLTDGNITPSQATQNQLRDAIRNIVDARVADVSSKVVIFTPATMAQALASGDTLATLFSKLAFWRIEYTKNLNNHAAIDATYDTKGHLKISPTGGLTIASGVLNLQAASTSANGYMSSTDKTRLDNLYNTVIQTVYRTVSMTVTDKIFTWAELNIQQDNYIVFLQVVGLYYQDIIPQYVIEQLGIHIQLNKLGDVDGNIISKWGSRTWGSSVWADEDQVTFNLLITKL